MSKKSTEQVPIDPYRDMNGLEARYGRGRRQLKRWVDEKILPPPDAIINNHPFWKDSTLDAADKANTIAAGKTEFGRRRKLIAVEQSPPASLNQQELDALRRGNLRRAEDARRRREAKAAAAE
jgi:hypothetical protein